MADVILNNYSDDSRIKQYIRGELMERVFHDIPISKLNTGAFSIISEYISQATEQMAFTSSFYFNENFITKAVLPESIYAEAAIFNLGYAFANPSTTNILLELKLDDLFAITQNAENKNAETGLYEFVLDKNTLINMKDGQTYSLDYDISFQYMNPTTASDTRNGAWIVQYLNDEPNSISVNKNKYISYRVTDNWLCLFIKASEYTRQTHTVINNMTNNVPNQDTVITCNDHICGFDVVYIEPATKAGESDKRVPIRHDHILPIHSTVNDQLPYVHYIMDNTQTIRFMWQLQGTKAFIPKLNSRYEITVYTCHGRASNFDEAPNEQPNVVTATNRFKNNANVMKAAFIISGSLGGTDIGTAENVRRKTIEAYNTANVISTDHDIEEWFKTFYFEHILFPFFFKRRDDPWGRIWSGFLALTDQNDEVYRTNTLHGNITYDALYSNNSNNVSNNEIIIPPGWVWTYKDSSNLYTLAPYIAGDNHTVETAKTLTAITDKFVFANPFGVRIQKSPFAIGYFNPWINESLTASRVPMSNTYIEDSSQIYHATPLTVHIKRTYKDDYYHISFWLDVSQNAMVDGDSWIKYMTNSAVKPVFDDMLWQYFKRPTDVYAQKIPMLALQADEQALPFNPSNTYLCVSSKNLRDDGYWNLSNIWIQDNSDPDNIKRIDFNVINSNGIIGSDNVWGNSGLVEPIYVTGDTTIICYGLLEDDVVSFERIGSNDYYAMKIKDKLTMKDNQGNVRPIQINRVTFTVTSQSKTERTKYGEDSLYQIGQPMQNVVLNAHFEYIFTDVTGSAVGTLDRTYTISNAAEVFIPYPSDATPQEVDRMWTFTIPTRETAAGIAEGTSIVYADMRPSPTSASVDYYRIPFKSIHTETAFVYVENDSLKLNQNNLRVVLHAYMNGGETGYVEMRPVQRDTDGTYLFEADMYPTCELVDIDNIIHIASVDNSGGSWKPTTQNTVVNIDATNPKLRVSVLFKAKTNPDMPSLINGDSDYNGYYVNDQFELDSFSLIQELKEMRSVVNFSEDNTPTFDQYQCYQNILSWNRYNSDHPTWYDINKIAHHQAIVQQNLTEDEITNLKRMAVSFNTNGYFGDLEEMRTVIGLSSSNPVYQTYYNLYTGFLNRFTNSSGFTELFTYQDSNVQQVWKYHDKYYTNDSYTDELKPVEGMYYMIKNTYEDITFVTWSNTYRTYTDVTNKVVMWNQVYEALDNYTNELDKVYTAAGVALSGGVEVQLMPFVEYSLMNSDQFADFVATFTQVHKAIEPVIFRRLEGNNYLDCKLIATYGKPHTYCSDQQYKLTTDQFWPDLNVQISFDVKLYNKALASNTVSELKLKIKAYFNRLTTVHTPIDLISMNNNIYVSHLIQQMEEHSNVAYLKFNGWYTDEKNMPNGNYMDSNTQAILQRWRKLEDMPTDELTRFVPEMFVLEDRNIKINILDDYTLS